MPDAQPPQTTPAPEEKVKKQRNWVWWIAIVLLLGPSAYLAWNIIGQPAGNQTFFDMNRPDNGAAFDVLNAEIIDDDIELTVTYPGGCGDHQFDLYIEEQQSDINRLLEVHHITDDTCDTRVTEDLSYDLSKTIEEHDSPQIVFTISGNGEEPDPILFKKPEPEEDLTP